MKKLTEVFGVSSDILEDSYVDRGKLDADLKANLDFDKHICIRGESKSGKSWLRKRVVPDALVVQCRLNESVVDLYVDALSQLNVNFEKSHSKASAYEGTISGSGEFGWKLISKVKVKLGLTAHQSSTTESQNVGHDINDLRFIAELIKESGRRFVIEDFHYMSMSERGKFAHELKALWDYGLMAIVVGVWNNQNMLLYLNPDLTGRVHEISLSWGRAELVDVLNKGGRALNVTFEEGVSNRISEDVYGNVGLLQNLTQSLLLKSNVLETQKDTEVVSDIDFFESIAMIYAEQLEPLYHQFAKSVSEGIRKRDNTTAIYAHAMNVIVNQSDDALQNGLSRDDIFSEAHRNEPRIQSGNMHQILAKLDSLQVDAGGRGLILSYNEMTKELFIVDKQFLFYRKYCTIQWPWEDLISELSGKAQ